jgi:hypothetical protein
MEDLHKASELNNAFIQIRPMEMWKQCSRTIEELKKILSRLMFNEPKVH